eukprot:CAMPEP_0185269434 /NCGR_PEP_ID=MMETSP1359-20130426/39795_1 /TAXON_ID=552665 /ORGANISM="Bigelowiella longifila, Strain CCMP242" /LENGTH=214 /DNA_ID=CAMNT_0027860585 /DNA_START=626 /DNA_END=1270 /DNA_ORIENTATION=-
MSSEKKAGRNCSRDLTRRRRAIRRRLGTGNWSRSYKPKRRPLHRELDIMNMDEQPSCSRWSKARKCSLRFSVGDIVWCSFEDEWCRAEVVAYDWRSNDWKEGKKAAAYQLRLLELGQEESLIYAPEDNDNYVRETPPCKYTPKEKIRFDIGNPVQCKVGEDWVNGIVLGHNYREIDWDPDEYSPYQVQIVDNNDRRKIYVPVDSDILIRRRHTK